VRSNNHPPTGREEEMGDEVLYQAAPILSLVFMMLGGEQTKAMTMKTRP
jgi:hypothetical protein